MIKTFVFLLSGCARNSCSFLHCQVYKTDLLNLSQQKITERGVVVLSCV